MSADLSRLTQTERRRYKTQCQTILLHTSVKLGFNGHIITFLPMKLRQSQLHPFAFSVYLRAHNKVKLRVTFPNSQGLTLHRLNLCLAGKQLE